MPTNLNIDDELLDEALKLSGKRTKRETVNEALRAYIQYLRRLKALDLIGKIDFAPDYDYKAARRKR